MTEEMEPEDKEMAKQPETIDNKENEVSEYNEVSNSLNSHLKLF